MNEALKETLDSIKGFICDMDGVIYHGNRLLPGVPEFVDWLYREDKNFLFLTNSSERSPLELKEKLSRLGLDIDESHFYTSALATAKFLSTQSPVSACSVYILRMPPLSATAWIRTLSPVLNPVCTPSWCSPACPLPKPFRNSHTARSLF